MLKSGLKTEIFKTGNFRTHNYNKDIGIEVELEGTVLPLDVASPENRQPTYWMTKSDSSLRDGFEYVLALPIQMDSLEAALSELEYFLGFMKPRHSIRTSTHIHINVLKQTIEEVYQSIFFYYLIEELLVATLPKERIGNLFCLRMSDASHIHWSLTKSLESQSYFQMFTNEHRFKYSALNMCTITRFGSLEFRLFPAMTTPDILRWSKTCHEIVRNGSKISLVDLLKQYNDLPVKQFLAKMLPNSEWLYEKYTNDFLNECLHTNYDRLVDLSEIFGKESYTVPRALWDDDAEELSKDQLMHYAIVQSVHGDAPSITIFDDPWASPPEHFEDTFAEPDYD